jgi:hypothetical protein
MTTTSRRKRAKGYEKSRYKKFLAGKSGYSRKQRHTKTKEDKFALEEMYG